MTSSFTPFFNFFLQIIAPNHSTVFKVINSHNGLPYAMRRVINFRLSEPLAMVSVDKWKTVRHPGVSPLLDVFTNKQFHDHSLVFIYEYHPCADTLHNVYLSGNGVILDEKVYGKGGRR